MHIKSVKLVEMDSPKQKYSRVYIWPEGESLLENIMNRRSRPTKLYRDILPGLREYLVANYGAYSGMSFRWNQKAGCTCGCSPGFVLDCGVRNKNHYYSDVHVTVA